MSYALHLSHITKDYPGVRAVADVSVAVRPGEVHAFLGENGAGKSTLVGIAAGSVVPTSGTIELLGETIERSDPADIRRRGLGIVYQIPALAPALSVADAFQLIVPERIRPGARGAVAWVQGCLDRLGIAVDATATVGSLSQRQAHLVEIGAALVSEPKVLILDEPTEALGPDETEWLFARIRELAARDVAIVYITHRIPEVLDIATRLTVLRDGRIVGEGLVSDFDADGIVELIIGRSLETTFPPRGNPEADAPVVLEVEQMSGTGFTSVSLTVRAGEICGVAGVEGNGQREFLRAIGGADRWTGAVRVDGAPVTGTSARAARRRGIVLLPGDRLGEALFGGMTIRENVVAPGLDAVSSAGVPSGSSQRRATMTAIGGLGVKAPSIETTVAALSGGNQQKVLLARARTESCRVLLVEDPTQGVDAGARVEIYKALREIASAGAAVVVLSTDAVELEGLCDRVAVFSRGQVRTALAGAELTERSITGSAVLSTARHDDVAAAAGGTSWRSRLRQPGTGMQVGLLLLLTALLGLRTRAASPAFLSTLNLTELLSATALVVFVALAQFLVVLTGGIDLSVGSMVALGCVVASFFGDGGVGGLALGALACLAVGGAVGLVNGVLATKVGVPHVIATLVTSIAVVGVAQIIRPKPDGFASSTVLDLLQHRIGFVPTMLPVACLVAAAVAWVVARTHIGRALRAAGSDETRAGRMGVHVAGMRLGAAAMSGVLAGAAGVVYYGRTGIGDANAGQALTLTSVTAIVIAGVSIFGGSGSALSVAAAALLLQTITNSLTFLSLSIAWQYWIQGAFVLLAAIGPTIAARRRRVRPQRAAAPSDGPVALPSLHSLVGDHE